MSDDLVERLEYAAVSASNDGDAKDTLYWKARDSIRALTASLAQVTAERDEWESACLQARDGCNQRSATITSLRTRLEAALEAAEADNAKLREALKHLPNIAENFMLRFNVYDLPEDKAQQWQALEREISLARALATGATK